MGDIQDALARYRQYYDATMPDIEMLRAVIANMERPLKDLEGCLKTLVTEEGESIEGYGVTVTYRRGYDREKWNGKALNGYAAAHPEVLTFKTVTKVEPTAAIKVEKTS